MAQSASLTLSGLNGRLCSSLHVVFRGDVELQRTVKKDTAVVTLTPRNSAPFKLKYLPRRAKDSLKAVGKEFTLVLPIADNDAKTLQKFEDFCNGKNVVAATSSNRSSSNGKASGTHASGSSATSGASGKLPQQGRMVSASSGASRSSNSNNNKGNSSSTSVGTSSAPQKKRAPPLTFEQRDSMPANAAASTTPAAFDGAASRLQPAKVAHASFSEQPSTKKQRHVAASSPPLAVSPLETMSNAQRLLQRGGTEHRQLQARGYGLKKRPATEEAASASPLSAFGLSPSSNISTPERASSSSSWKPHFSAVCSSPCDSAHGSEERHRGSRAPQTTDLWTPKSKLNTATPTPPPRSTYGSSTSRYSQLGRWCAPEDQKKSSQARGSQRGRASKLAKQLTNSALTKFRWKKTSMASSFIPRGGDAERGGFANLGNTCYIAAVLSALLHQERFIRDLASPIWAHILAAAPHKDNKNLSTPSAGSLLEVQRAPEIDGRSAAAPFDLTTALHSDSTSSNGSSSSTSSSGSSSDSNIPVRDGRLVRSLLGVVKAFADRKEALQGGAEKPSQHPATATSDMEGAASGLLDTPPRKKPPASIPSLNLGGLKLEVERISGRFVGNNQQDAHEFLGDLINAIHDDLAPFASDIDRAILCGHNEKTGTAVPAPVNSAAAAAAAAKAVLPSEGTYPAKAAAPTARDALPKPVAGTTAPQAASALDALNAEAEARLAARAEAESAQTAALLDDVHPLLPTARAFHAEVEVTLQCVCCGYERRRIEHYRDFSLDLPPPLPTPSPVVADNSPSPLTTSSSTKMPQVPCPFFNRSSGCKDGANCKFAHSASSSSACGKDSTSSTTSSTSSTSNIGSRPSPAVCLESLLEQFFGQETLQVDCEKCPGKTAIKSQKLAALPGTLVLHLKRFEQPNPYQQPDRFEKRTDRIAFRSDRAKHDGRTSSSLASSSSNDSSHGKNCSTSNRNAARFGVLDLSSHCTEFTRNPPDAISPIATAITPPPLPPFSKAALSSAANAGSESGQAVRNKPTNDQPVQLPKKHKSEVSIMDANAQEAPISVASDDDEPAWVNSEESAVSSSIDPASFFKKTTKDTNARKSMALCAKQRWTFNSVSSSSSSAFPQNVDEEASPSIDYDVLRIPSESLTALMSPSTSNEGESAAPLPDDASLRAVFELLAATGDLTLASLQNVREEGSSSSNSSNSGLSQLVQLVEANLNLSRGSLTPHATAISIAARRVLRTLQHQSERAEEAKEEQDGVVPAVGDETEGESGSFETEASTSTEKEDVRGDEKSGLVDGAEDGATLMSADREEEESMGGENGDEEGDEEPLLPRVQRSEELKACYQLTAVVHHLGEYAFAGHYVTSARCQNSDEKVEAQSNRAHRSDTVKAPEGDGVVAVGDDAIVDLTSDEAPSGSKESEDRSKHGGWVHFDDSVTKPMDAKSVQNLAEESGYIYFFTALSSS